MAVILVLFLYILLQGICFIVNVSCVNVCFIANLVSQIYNTVVRIIVIFVISFM